MAAGLTCCTGLLAATTPPKKSRRPTKLVATAPKNLPAARPTAHKAPGKTAGIDGNANGSRHASRAEGACAPSSCQMASGTVGSDSGPLQRDPGGAGQEGIPARRGIGRLESGFGRCPAPLSAGSKLAGQRQAGFAFDYRVGAGPEVLIGPGLRGRALDTEARLPVFDVLQPLFDAAQFDAP